MQPIGSVMIMGKTRNWLATMTGILLLFSSAFAQVNIHKGDYIANYNVAWTIQDAKVYQGSVHNTEGYQYFVDQNRFYKGKYKTASNCLFTLKGDKVYLGKTVRPSSCVYTIHNNQVFKHNSLEEQSCIYTVKNNKVYIGCSTGPENVFMTLDGEVDLAILTCILEIDYYQEADTDPLENSSSRTFE